MEYHGLLEKDNMKPLTPTKQEIERKWILNSVPSEWLLFRGQVKQGYLSLSPEVRLKKVFDILAYNADNLCVPPTTSHYLTIKRGKGMVRDEAEIQLTEAQFDTLSVMPVLSFIHKDYMQFELTDTKKRLEVSVILNYHSISNDRLIIAEIEFASEEEASAFQPTEFRTHIIREVTGIPEYSMALLGSVANGTANWV